MDCGGPGLKGTVTVATPNCWTSTNVLSIGNGTLVISLSITPSSGQQGQINHPGPHRSRHELRRGNYRDDVDDHSPTSATAVIVVSGRRRRIEIRTCLITGPRSILNGFGGRWVAAVPSISSVSPLQLTVWPRRYRGSEYAFCSGNYTQVSFGSDHGQQHYGELPDLPLATVTLVLAANARSASRDVTVTTGSEVVTLVGGCPSARARRILTSTSPASGQSRAVTLSLYSHRELHHFTQGTTQVSLGAGNTVFRAIQSVS